MSAKTLIVVLAGIIIFSPGCRVKREVASLMNSEKGGGDLIVNTRNKNISNQSFYIRKAVVNYFDSINNLTFLMSLKYNGDGKYISVIRTITGIELYRVFLDRDTFLINDRLSRRVLKGKTSLLLTKYGLNFNSLNWLVGDLPEIKYLSTSDRDCTDGVKAYSGIDGNFEVRININCNEEKVEDVYIKSGNSGFELEAEYSGFSNKGLTLYPKEVTLKEKLRGYTVNINLNEVDIPLVENFEFVQGKDYEIIILN